MGERISATFQVGGRMTREVAQDLVDAANGYRMDVDWGGISSTVKIEHLGMLWTGNEINYGNLDDLIDICAANNVDYDYWYDSGPDWDANRTRCIGGVCDSFNDGNEGPSIPISQLVKLDALATGWADLRARIRRWEQKLSPVEIVEEQENVR